MIVDAFLEDADGEARHQWTGARRGGGGAQGIHAATGKPVRSLPLKNVKLA